MAALVLAALPACAPPVVVASPPAQAPAAVISVTNSLGTAVNVYLVAEGVERLLGQVGSNSTRALPVPDVAPGTRVTLRAARVDGSTSYTRADFVLERESSWRLP